MIDQSHWERAVDAPRGPLAGCRVLVVEDEYMIADDVTRAVRGAGGEVEGPFATLEKALAAVASDGIDLAVVDINLRGDMAYPLADALIGQNIPFVFATGYDAAAIPERYRHVPLWEKPYNEDRLVESLVSVRAQR